MDNLTLAFPSKARFRFGGILISGLNLRYTHTHIYPGLSVENLLKLEPGFRDERIDSKLIEESAERTKQCGSEAFRVHARLYAKHALNACVKARRQETR